MKVCFVTHDAPQDIGGGSSGLRRLLPLLQMAGIEVEAHVMAIGGRPGLNCASFREHGIPVRLMPFLVHLPYAVRTFLQFLEEGQPDIYVPGQILAAYYAGGYARRAGIPTVGVLRADDLYNRGIMDEFIKGDRDFRVSAVVAVSRFLELQVSPIARALGVIVRRIHSGVPIPARAAKYSRSPFRLVYTGNLVEEQKRISDLANAFCAVAQSIPNLEAWIAGEGGARPTVEDIIRTKEMGARVHLLGLVDNAHIYDVLAQCQGLALLSDYEGMPVSMMEAMAAGVVPICLDTRSGIREAIEHRMNGLIVKDRGADFFDAVRELQCDPEKWQRLSLAARDTARQRFSIEESAHQWIDLLRDLHTPRTARADFKAPRVLQLPPPDPKFDIFGKTLTWTERVGQYIRATPPLYRVAKSTIALGRKMRCSKT
jgi:glycosyltransferase involved in cell wall biosynthesis